MRVGLGITIGGLLLACGAIAAAGTESYRREDFWCLRTAGELAIRGADPYDAATWSATAAAPIPLAGGGTTRSPCTGATFAYPFWTALAMVPFAVLPLAASAAAWISLSVGAVALGVAGAWSAFRGPIRATALCVVVVAFSQPLWLVLRYGQTTALELGLLGLAAWSMARGRERSAGVAFAALLLKPQLVFLAWPVLLVDAARARRRPFLFTVIGATAAILVLSLLVAPRWPLEWLATVLGPRIRIAPLLPTVWGLASDTLGAPAWGALLVVALVLALIRLLRGVFVDRVSLLALGVSVSLFASPHVWTYDHLLLAVPWAATLAIAARLGARGRPLRYALVLVAVVLPWSAFVVAFLRVSETHAAVVPALSALLLALALRARARCPLALVLE